MKDLCHKSNGFTGCATDGTALWVLLGFLAVVFVVWLIDFIFTKKDK